jgi:hypothetical protein
MSPDSRSDLKALCDRLGGPNYQPGAEPPRDGAEAELVARMVASVDGWLAEGGAPPAEGGSGALDAWLADPAASVEEEIEKDLVWVLQQQLPGTASPGRRGARLLANELFVRWHQAGRDPIPPEVFFPLAAEVLRRHHVRRAREEEARQGTKQSAAAPGDTVLSVLRYADDTVADDFGTILRAEPEWEELRRLDPELYGLALLHVAAGRFPEEVADLTDVDAERVKRALDALRRKSTVA